MEEVRSIWVELGRPGRRKLLEGLRRRGVRVPVKVIDAFVKEQTSTQLLRRRRRLGGRLVAGRENDMWQVDLLEQTGRPEDGFNFVLVAVDAMSRQIAAEPLRTKTARDTWEGFLKIIRRLGRPKAIETDVGGEFQGIFEQELRDRSISKVEIDPRSNTGLALVNSAIQRLRRAIAKELLDEGHNSWLRALPNAVRALNKRPLDALYGGAPEEVAKNPELNYVVRVNRGQDMLQNGRRTDILEDQLKAAKRFRVLLPKRDWLKEGVPRYSTDVFQVARVENGYVYTPEGDKYRMSLVLPVGAGAKTTVAPPALSGANVAASAAKRQDLDPFIEALKVRLRSVGSLTLREAGTYLSTIPGYTAAVRRHRLEGVGQGFEGVFALYQDVLQVRGEGVAARVVLRAALPRRPGGGLVRRLPRKTRDA